MINQQYTTYMSCCRAWTHDHRIDSQAPYPHTTQVDTPRAWSLTIIAIGNINMVYEYVIIKHYVEHAVSDRPCLTLC